MNTDHSDANVQEALLRVSQGDIDALDVLRRCDETTLRRALEAVGTLIVGRQAVIRVIDELLAAQRDLGQFRDWADLIHYGFIRGWSAGRFEDAFDYEQAHEDTIAPFIVQLEDHGEDPMFDLTEEEILEYRQRLNAQPIGAHAEGSNRKGPGDYTAERHAWLDDVSIEDVVQDVERRRAAKPDA